MPNLRKYLFVLSILVSSNLYANEIEKRFVYCVSKNDISFWYWVMNPNGSYLEVNGIQSFGICSPYIFFPKARLEKNFFFIDDNNYEVIEKICGDNYYAQPGEARSDSWYRFAKGNPKLNNFTVMPGYQLCKNNLPFNLVVLRDN
ncbi:hypothetical protein [Fluviispira multicolorata]|uniref:Uncharacterized protein n=1 Tax=Fluviispira multicolorata TaxID=2654512 RepID=A0A833N4T1_9BACT|nr:hypothetical protein [Fluviispira multicolorata]KAB8031763.1 hypothetical protein GCL57_03745 [Fluviispira multicolorata]